MNLFECIRLALNSLVANKLRAFLTMLGIIIGISAVITITTLGSSVGKTLDNSFNTMGLNFIYTYIDIKPEFEDDDDVYFRPDDLLSEEFINDILTEYPDRFGWISSQVSVGTGTADNYKDKTVTANICGIGDGDLEAQTIRIIMGRDITSRDCIEEKRTAVVSDVFVNQYFRNGEYPIGKTVDFICNGEETQSFTIVGVYRMKSSDKRLEPNQKESDLITNVYVPYQTAVKIKGDTNESLYHMEILIRSGYDFDESKNILENYVNEHYKNNPRVMPVFLDPHEDMEDISIVLGIVTGVFSLIAMISLLVGGVGVMNIMLVSIIERTREIGVRKALGARNNDIRLQFVVEAIIICLIGGIIGILVGIGNGFLLELAANFYMNNIDPDVKDELVLKIEPSVFAIIGSLLFCMMIGIFFGLYPANKAAKMNPIDALRYD